MSKSLVKEYKEYIQMETPDLWDRIEREISVREKQTEVQLEVKNLSSEKVSVEKPVFEKETKERKRNIRKWSTYGSLAAAALVVVCVLTFVNGGMKSEEASADMSVMDTAGGTVAKENAAVTVEEAADMEAAEGAQTLDVTVTIVEIGVTDDGTVFYTGVTESGEYYSFTVAEGVVFVDESEESNGQIEGGKYRVELVLDGEMYRAVEVWN